MEGSSSQPLPIPRLRLTRRASNLQLGNGGMADASIAGPSRTPTRPFVDLTHDYTNDSDDDLGAGATPRVPPSSALPLLGGTQFSGPNVTPADTPAARLRALLSRVPNQPSSSSNVLEKETAPPSELDSDFDTPHFSPTTPSIAQESLKDLFSRALRDPGDTPQKRRRRRNSIDVSEVEASPRVERERAKYKTKRQSLSDDELDKPSRSRSSQAAAFDSLRQRLVDSHAKVKKTTTLIVPHDLSESDMTNGVGDDSHDTAEFLRDLDSSQVTPPAATSTPQRSLQMPSGLQFDSNLLEQDSDMQDAMKGLDSYDADSPSRQGPLSFPPSRSPQTPPHTQPAMSHDKPHIHDRTHGKPLIRHGSENASLSRSTSSLSGGGHKESKHHPESEHVHERELGWNKPHAKKPELTHRHSVGSQPRSQSPIITGSNGRSRRDSSVSLRSVEDAFSSKPRSPESRADHRERPNDLDNEHISELEHGWNKRHPKTSRPTSSQDMHSPHERSRTHSHSARPVSGPSKPQRPPTHSHTSSRASSPTNSLHSHGSAKGHDAEIDDDFVHERERNWNAPRPRWDEHPSHRHPDDRPTSSLSVHSPHDRQRTHSHPTRPDSAHSLRSPALHRHDSHSSSRTSSPTGSLRSHGSAKDHEVEVPNEVVHERERNWNAPRPKWHDHPGNGHHARPVSPLPPPHPHSRIRAESLGTHKGEASIDHQNGVAGKPPPRHTTSGSSLKTPVQKQAALPHSPLPGSTSGKQPASHVPHPPSHSPRSISPLPPAARGSRRKEKSTETLDLSSQSGWQFPRNKTALPPLDLEYSPERPPIDPSTHTRMPSSPSPILGTGTSNRPSGTSSGSHIPLWSPKKFPQLGQNGKPVEHKKGHRRNMTEMSESVGRIPPIIHVDNISALAGTQHPDQTNNGSAEELSATNTTFTPRPALAQLTDESIFPSDTPSTRVAVSNDEARLQKALSMPLVQEISPPPSSSPITEPTPSGGQLALGLSTPTRRPSLSTPRVEFHSPPPPNGLPELPGPPSSCEDEADDHRDHSPPRRNWDSHPDLSSIKTPKPPGAWTTTPASNRQPLGRSHSLPQDHDESHYDSGLATPVASLSRATSMPPQTPALPGSWMSTPSLSRRKSVQKVRFDVESEQSVAENTVDGRRTETPVTRPSLPADSLANHFVPTSSKHDGSQSSETTPIGTIRPEEAEFRPRTPESPVKPSARSPRSPRKSPSIRVVDAFGREESSANGISNGALEELPSPTTANGTPRNKSAVRIVDAMGREVEEVVASESEIKSEEEPPLSHRETLSRVRQGIIDLASGFSDADRSGDDLLNDHRLNELEEVSRAAREARNKLAKSLRVARGTEDDLRSKYGPLRMSMKKSSFLPQITHYDRLSWARMSSWTIWSLIFVQLLIIIVMYRFATIRARELFLTTYYDPFYPDLHLYTTKPDTLRHSVISSMARSPSWSIFSLPYTFQRYGWRAVAEHVWDSFSLFVSDCQRQAWEAWGAEDQLRGTSWPPT